MFISPVQTYNPAYRGNNREVFNKSGKFLYKTTTYFFREDLNWTCLAELLGEKYKTVQKVNVLNHACSNGQEPYTLAVKLIQILGKEAKKFFPIQAKDIDFDNIESANRGRLGIKLNEMYRINHYTKNQLTSFFTLGKPADPNNDLVLIPKENIKSKVNFSQADILKDTSEKLPDNTVILCRNFWPYLAPAEREQLASNLYQNIGDNSLIITGDFDYRSNTPDLLKSRGFVEIGMNNVYIKR